MVARRLALGILVSSLAMLCQAQTPYATLVQQGNTQLQSGNATQALVLGQQAIKLDPSRWEAYALTGGTLMNLQRYDDAITQLSNALSRAPAAKQPAIQALIKKCVQSESGAATPPPPTTAATTPPQPTVSQAEIVMWETIKNSTNLTDFQTYLQQYPKGAYVALANAAINNIWNQQIAAQTAASQKAAQDLAAGIWTDPATGLMWSINGNGPVVDWNDANQSCVNSSQGGYSGWRLATLNELTAIDDTTVAAEYHIKGGIQVLGWTWSSTPKNSSNYWAYCFSYNQNSTYKTSWHTDTRALCVRNP